MVEQFAQIGVRLDNEEIRQHKKLPVRGPEVGFAG